MQDLLALVYTLIGFVVLGVLVAIIWGICELIFFIKDKRHKKWRARIFENHPELKVLLSEYHRLRTEHGDTARSVYNLREAIDDLIEQNKYLPEGHRMDKHIENLKEQYRVLLDIRTKESKLVDQAEEDLVKFWETNFPDLPEHKRIMWWSE